MKSAIVAIAASLALGQNSSDSSLASDESTCKLQFLSPCTKDAECGDINGYAMSCITSGSNRQCGCKGGKSGADKCQNTAMDGSVPLFGDCTNRKCNQDFSGFTPYDLQDGEDPQPKCAEKLFCVQEMNEKKDVILRSQCHTCGSCKAQSIKGKRFNCAKICKDVNSTSTSSSGSDSGSSNTRPPKKADPDTPEPNASSTVMVSVVIVGLVAMASQIL
jgi:hypothetical protein